MSHSDFEKMVLKAACLAALEVISEVLVADDGSQDTLAGAVAHEEVEEGEPLFEQGDAADKLYILLSGKF